MSHSHARTILTENDGAPLSESLRGLEHELRERMGRGHAYSGKEFKTLLADVGTMAKRAEEIEAAPVPAGFINDAAVQASTILDQAEMAVGKYRRELIERHKAPKADPSGRIATGLTVVMKKIEQAAAIVAGDGTVQS